MHHNMLMRISVVLVKQITTLASPIHNSDSHHVSAGAIHVHCSKPAWIRHMHSH
jgi:hypothetical protein